MFALVFIITQKIIYVFTYLFSPKSLTTLMKGILCFFSCTLVSPQFMLILPVVSTTSFVYNYLIFFIFPSQLIWIYSTSDYTYSILKFPIITLYFCFDIHIYKHKQKRSLLQVLPFVNIFNKILT